MRCGSCGQENRPGARFCDACGTRLVAAAPAADAERRQLTAMFCDLVESTALSERLDPEELREVVRAYQNTAAAVIAHANGHVAQYLGDGLLVYFGYPRAHEDDARRAVHAGLGIVAAIDALNVRLAADKRVRLAVRVGIHTGPVVVGEVGGGERRERLALGDTLNIAARLQGVAAPGTVVVSGATHRLTGGWFRCAPLGALALKGLTQPVVAYHALAELGAADHAAGSAGLTPLVAREHETALLVERWEQVREHGRAEVVLLAGEAGIGKSRLVRVLRERLAADAHGVREGACAPHLETSAFSAVIDLLRRALPRGDDDAGALGRLETLVGRIALPLAETVPLLAALAGVPVGERYPPLAMSPERQRARTQECVLAWLLAEASLAPLLFVVEDLHWADPSTLELLGRLFEHVLAPTAVAPLLVLCTYRPEFRPPWDDRARLTRVALNRLARRDSAHMIGLVAGERPLPRPVVEQLVTRTDGVPLYVEELTKMVLESGAPGADGAGAALEIPATLRDSLTARLDRLDSAKEVAQLAAALGREFPDALLRAVTSLEPPALEQGLARLVDAELLFPRGTDDDRRYVFKHALIQEAAYESLLKSVRQQHHRRIADVLAARFPDLVATQPELLAHHYTQAGLAAEAVACWQRAAERAFARSANAEVVEHVGRAMQLIVGLPETPERDRHELGLQTRLGAALMATEGYGSPRVERAFTRAWALCQRIGDPPVRLSILNGLNAAYVLQGKLQAAHEVSERLLALTAGSDDADRLLEAHFAMGQSLLFRGEFAAAHEHLERGLALYDPEHARGRTVRIGQDMGTLSFALSGVALWHLGEPERALAQSRQGLAVAEEVAHKNSLGSALFFLGYLHVLRREPAAARPHAEALAALAQADRFPFWAAGAEAILGWAMITDGRGADGVARMREGLAAWRAAGAQLPRMLFLVVLAEACGHLGAIDDGLRLLDEALFLASQNAEHTTEAEIHRVRGELLRGTNAAEAEAAFRQALESAHRQGTRALALRAATSLARGLADAGRGTEARAALANVYATFHEGHDTADLRDAAAMLAALDRPGPAGRVRGTGPA